MKIHEIYGVGEPSSAPAEHTDDASDIADEPTEFEEQQSPDKPPATGSPQNGPQTPPNSGVAAPTRDAVAEIERLLANGDRPISAAVPFLDTPAHKADTNTPQPRATPKLGLLKGLSALWSLRDDPDTDDGADTDDEADTAQQGLAGRTSNRHPMLATRHTVVVCAFATAALLAAAVIGRSTAHHDEVDTSAPAAPAPAHAAGTDRSAPITPADVQALTCGVGSTNPMDAFKNDKSKAWRCLAPYDGVGQIMTITLPGPYIITSICVMPGFDAAAPDKSDMWIKNRVVSMATWRFDDKSPTPQKFNGTRKQQCVAVPRHLATVVTMTINKTDAPKASPATKTADTGPPNPLTQPSWLDGISQGLKSPGEPPIQNADADQPHAFAASSIQIIGERVQ